MCLDIHPVINLNMIHTYLTTYDKEFLMVNSLLYFDL